MEQVRARQRDDPLEAIRVELDQYWDLLRQRQAREDFGQVPDRAVVEKYEG